MFLSFISLTKITLKVITSICFLCLYRYRCAADAHIILQLEQFYNVTVNAIARPFSILES